MFPGKETGCWRLVHLRLPQDNLFGVPAGRYPAVLANYFFVLRPLSVGQHTITEFDKFPGATAELTYHISVVRNPNRYRKPPKRNPLFPQAPHPPRGLARVRSSGMYLVNDGRKLDAVQRGIAEIVPRTRADQGFPRQGIGHPGWGLLRRMRSAATD